MIPNPLSISLCLLVACAGLAFAQSPTTLPSTAPSATAGALNNSRVPHPKPKPGVIEEMTTKELGNFDFDQDKGSPIPADVTALDGTTIRLRGYMIPIDQAEKITAFALVDDLFGQHGQTPPPLTQQTTVVKMPAGKPTWYMPDAITVEGRLHVRVQKEDGFIVSIFDVDATSVQPVEPNASHGPTTQPH